MRRLNTMGLVLGALALGACAEVPTGAGSSGPYPLTGDAAVTCAHPRAGCACDQDVPIDCYGEAQHRPDGTLLCSRGTRYCRGGFWTECVSVEEYELRSGPGIAPIIEGPVECNPCDPACSYSTDRPEGPGDVTPGNSSGVEYDSNPGGIEIIPDMGSTMGGLPDTDGDGVPDVADDCVGPGAYMRSDGTCAEHRDGFLYHTLPYGGPAEVDPLQITAQVRTADIYFLMDTTGSMGGEINNLQNDLTSGTFISGCPGGIIGAIRCTIPDAWFGVGYFDDYPVSPYGGSGDNVYRNLQDITGSISAAQTGVNALTLHWGNDGPESNSQALWAVATGGSLGPYLGARSGCPAGHWGYPCFRPGTIPVVVQFTDAPMHQGPSGYNYSSSTLCGTSSSPSLPSATFVSGNDTQGSARYIGDAATTWTGWRGNTCSHANNYGASCAWGGAGYGNDSRDVVFRFDVSTTSTIRITTDGSDYDTLISLRNSSFSEIACSEDDGPGLLSELNVTLSPGTYYLVVMGWSTNCGNYRVSIGNPSAGSGSTCDIPKTWPQVISALNTNNVRVITVQSCDGQSWCHPEGVDDASALANSTGSTNSSGSPYVFPINDNGTGLSAAVVNAIVDLANYNRLDISARATDDPGTTGVDERGFVQSITPVGWGPGSCTGISGSTFLQCLPGTNVNFSVTFRNDFVMPSTVPQVFDFFIEVVGDGSFVMDRIPVRIVVPADVPTYPPTGSYWRDHDSTTRCADNERPDWGDLSWTATTPGDTSIRFELRAADTLAGLGSASAVTFTDPSATSPVDVGARLVSAGQSNFRPYLRVTAVLNSSSDRTQSPTLTSMELMFTCTPTE